MVNSTCAMPLAQWVLTYSRHFTGKRLGNLPQPPSGLTVLAPGVDLGRGAAPLVAKPFLAVSMSTLGADNGVRWNLEKMANLAAESSGRRYATGSRCRS